MHFDSIDTLLAEVPRLAQAHQDKLAGHNALLLLQTTQGRKVYLQLTDGALTLSDSCAQPPEATVTASEEDLLAMVNGKLNPMTAVMFGKVKVQGSMPTLMSLLAILT